MTPRPVQYGGWGSEFDRASVRPNGGVEFDRASVRPKPSSVPRVRAGCGGQLFTAKLGVVVHYPTHQVFDQLLADQAILDGSAGTVGRCNGLRTRSLKPRPVAVSNRPTVTPACATPAPGANSTHPSPSARQFQLPIKWLAPSQLRRISCSDEGALVRVLRAPPNDPTACPAWGWGQLAPCSMNSNRRQCLT